LAGIYWLLRPLIRGFPGKSPIFPTLVNSLVAGPLCILKFKWKTFGLLKIQNLWQKIWNHHLKGSDPPPNLEIFLVLNPKGPRHLNHLFYTLRIFWHFLNEIQLTHWFLFIEHSIYSRKLLVNWQKTVNLQSCQVHSRINSLSRYSDDNFIQNSLIPIKSTLFFLKILSQPDSIDSTSLKWPH